MQTLSGGGGSPGGGVPPGAPDVIVAVLALPQRFGRGQGGPALVVPSVVEPEPGDWLQVANLCRHTAICHLQQAAPHEEASRYAQHEEIWLRMECALSAKAALAEGSYVGAPQHEECQMEECPVEQSCSAPHCC